MISKLSQCQNLRKATGNICDRLWHLLRRGQNVNFQMALKTMQISHRFILRGLKPCFLFVRRGKYFVQRKTASTSARQTASFQGAKHLPAAAAAAVATAAAADGCFGLAHRHNFSCDKLIHGVSINFLWHYFFP